MQKYVNKQTDLRGFERWFERSLELFELKFRTVFALACYLCSLIKSSYRVAYQYLILLADADVAFPRSTSVGA